jgi:hypothetical protein
MAHLRDITKPKCNCGKTATKHLFNRFNASQGAYCTSCANRELVVLARAEAKRHAEEAQED